MQIQRQPAVRSRKLLDALLFTSIILAMHAYSHAASRELRDGRLFVDGKWVYLKIGKPLRNFADAKEVDQLIADLPIIQQKNFNCLELNCYWHHFDHSGDGNLEESVEPLRKLIDAIDARGIFVCLSVETYGVGGGKLPEGFWKKHPDAIAVDSQRRKVSDDEYGFGSAVPSLYSPDYLKASRNFIRNIARAVQHEKMLYFETTVEPQFMGSHALDWSKHCCRAYDEWSKKNPDAPDPPLDWPVPESFLDNKIWNRFRAESLADWVNGDAAAYREVAGKDAWIAVDYLETCNKKDMRNRNGDSLIFLRNLTSPNIIQVNWHWHNASHSPNQCAYDNVKRVMKETNRAWAITEHMTINGTDYAAADMEKLLRNTIAQSTNFGWEFVDLGASKGDFSLYNPDWTPKPTMKVVDDNWAKWMDEIHNAKKN
jgi:hypothetical protein